MGLGVDVQEFITGKVSGEDIKYVALIRRFEEIGITRKWLEDFLELIKKLPRR